MGLIQFAKNVGRKLNIDDDDEKPQQQSQGQHPQNLAQARPAANQAANQQQLAQEQERRRETALASVVKRMGFTTEGLVVDIEGDKVTLRGNVISQEEREKIVLLVGNHAGIGAVDDQLKVKNPAPEAQYYEVQSGDTLSKIAKQYYGDASKYSQVFEANRPMLKDPDEIYPGQRLRIPASTQTGQVGSSGGLGSVGGSDDFGGYPYCFPAGTQIEMADGSLKAISEVGAGDWVRCWDHRQSGLAEAQIELVLSATVDKLVRLNGRLSASPAHRVFTERGYVRFDEVQIGDSLLRSLGTIPEPVTQVEVMSGSFSVFNLVVEPFACFFAEGLLVEDQIGTEFTEETSRMSLEPLQLWEAV